MPASTTHCLLCQVRDSVCALPIEHVIEVMRPLPVVPVAQAPEGVLGMCVMRGIVVPVIDLACCLLGEETSQATRFVAVRAGERRIALAVDNVLGASELARDRLAAVPALTAQACSAVDAIVALDHQLLLLLSTTRILPDFPVTELAAHA